MQKTLQRSSTRRRRIKLIVILIISLLLTHFGLLDAQEFEIDNRIKQLSSKERFFLRRVFQSLLKDDQFGHVLFFETKPGCFTSVYKQGQSNVFGRIVGYMYGEMFERKGWEWWQHHQNFFPHPNFIFLFEEVVVHQREKLDIFILNKKSLRSLLDKNLDFFKEELGSDFSSESFIASLETRKVLRPLIKNNEAILGCILGFGIESPTAFKIRYDKLIDKKAISPLIQTYAKGIRGERPKNSELEPVAFAGNPHSAEVIALVDNYNRELNEIWKLYKESNDPLRLVLNKLCKE